jgi:hypothetical protein
VNLTERSTALEVATSVADALSRAGFRAVLTGGGCASIYTKGVYQSVDLDFILQRASTQAELEAALAAIGFERQTNQYFHPRARFYVEFPPGPLSIGRDYGILPVALAFRGREVLALSATDSCRDRLAAFLFWQDRQNLQTAIQIALRNQIDFGKIEAWCTSEGVPEGFQEFSRELGIARTRGERRRRKSASRKRGNLRITR